jgi:rSAM/selenodomain-associated transferase 2
MRSCYRRSVTLSVVIPALDEADQIVGAIESASAPGVEIVVVDGSSTDATRERASAAGARVVVSAAGRAKQLAAGVDATRGDAVLFLHADTRLPSGFEAAVEKALGSEGAIGGSFRFRFDERSPALGFVEWGARLRVALFGIAYGDQALFVRRETLKAIGGIPQAPIMEDLDLVKAMRRQGRMVHLDAPVTTSARRYRVGGVLRTMFRNWLAATARWFGLDRGRIADWYRQ